MSDIEESYSSKLAVFQKPYVETAVTDISYVDICPKNNYDKGSSIEFYVGDSGPDYIDLSRCRLKVKARIVKPNGSKITASNKVCFVNLTLHSLFKRVDLLLQGKNTSPDLEANYCYKALLDVLLNYGYSAKDSQLQSELYFKDVGAMDAPPGKAENPGAEKRWEYTKAGLEVTMEGPLHLYICQQNRPILNGVTLGIKLYPQNDEFLLMSADSTQYSVEITDISFRVCYVRVTDAVILAQNNVLKMSPALYPFWRSKIKTFSVPKGISSFSSDDIFHGKVPAKLIVTLVKTQAYNGSYSLNPFNFVTGGVNSIIFAVNNKSVPQEPLEPNYSTGDYISSYLTLFCNKYPHHRGNFITRSDYAAGYTIYIFDVQGQAEDELMTNSKSGISQIALKFAAPTTDALTIIAYAIFPATLLCDHSRNIWWKE